MTETVREGACEYMPTLAERTRRWLGFRYQLGEEPNTDGLPGWMMTEVRLHFDLLDRLRLLISGQLLVKLCQHTDVQVTTSRNRVDLMIWK